MNMYNLNKIENINTFLNLVEDPTISDGLYVYRPSANLKIDLLDKNGKDNHIGVYMEYEKSLVTLQCHTRVAKRINKSNAISLTKYDPSLLYKLPMSYEVYNDIITYSLENPEFFKRFAYNHNSINEANEKTIKKAIRAYTDAIYHPTIIHSHLVYAIKRLGLSNQVIFGSNFTKRTRESDFNTFSQRLKAMMALYILCKYVNEPYFINSMHPDLAKNVGSTISYSYKNVDAYINNNEFDHRGIFMKIIGSKYPDNYLNEEPWLPSRINKKIKTTNQFVTNYLLYPGILNDHTRTSRSRISEFTGQSRSYDAHVGGIITYSMYNDVPGGGYDHNWTVKVTHPITGYTNDLWSMYEVTGALTNNKIPHTKMRALEDSDINTHRTTDSNTFSDKRYSYGIKYNLNNLVEDTLKVNNDINTINRKENRMLNALRTMTNAFNGGDYYSREMSEINSNGYSSGRNQNNDATAEITKTVSYPQNRLPSYLTSTMYNNNDELLSVNNMSRHEGYRINSEDMKYYEYHPTCMVKMIVRGYNSQKWSDLSALCPFTVNNGGVSDYRASRSDFNGLIYGMSILDLMDRDLFSSSTPSRSLTYTIVDNTMMKNGLRSGDIIFKSGTLTDKYSEKGYNTMAIEPNSLANSTATWWADGGSGLVYTHVFPLYLPILSRNELNVIETIISYYQNYGMSTWVTPDSKYREYLVAVEEQTRRNTSTKSVYNDIELISPNALLHKLVRNMSLVDDDIQSEMTGISYKLLPSRNERNKLPNSVILYAFNDDSNNVFDSRLKHLIGSRTISNNTIRTRPNMDYTSNEILASSKINLITTDLSNEMTMLAHVFTNKEKKFILYTLGKNMVLAYEEDGIVKYENIYTNKNYATPTHKGLFDDNLLSILFNEINQVDINIYSEYGIDTNNAGQPEGLIDRSLLSRYITSIRDFSSIQGDLEVNKAYTNDKVNAKLKTSNSTDNLINFGDRDIVIGNGSTDIVLDEDYVYVVEHSNEGLIDTSQPKIKSQLKDIYRSQWSELKFRIVEDDISINDPDNIINDRVREIDDSVNNGILFWRENANETGPSPTSTTYCNVKCDYILDQLPRRLADTIRNDYNGAPLVRSYLLEEETISKELQEIKIEIYNNDKLIKVLYYDRDELMNGDIFYYSFSREYGEIPFIGFSIEVINKIGHIPMIAIIKNKNIGNSRYTVKIYGR